MEKCLEGILAEEMDMGEEDLTTEETTEETLGWPEEEQIAFMEECTGAAAADPAEGVNPEEYCACMLGLMMDAYPTVEESVNMTMEDMMEMAETCVGS